MEPAATEEMAFPVLRAPEIEAIRPYGTVQECQEGCVLFEAGDPAVDFFIVLSGELEILNPADNNARVVVHKSGEFAGDIDLLTRRPVIVTCVARGKSQVLRVPGGKVRELLNRIPQLGEKLLVAFQVRRQMLAATGKVGFKIIGPADCKDTTLVREFLYKNFVPFTYFDTATPKGKRQLETVGSPKKTPAIVRGDGEVMLNPPLRDLAKSAGIWRDCPPEEIDLAVVGAGPAGIAAAVYAASEGLHTVVLDRLGPGGQAGGSSKIENFIGFPSGLSGAELASRGVLQMFKFGAVLSAPVCVQKVELAAGKGDPHLLHLDCGDILRAGVVLLATGVTWRRLEAKGMDRFENAGIYYACTTVEAELHEGQDVAVVGAGNSAGQAAMFLAERCARTVHMIIRRELGIGISEYLAERIRSTPGIHVHNFSEVREVFGERRIQEIEVENMQEKKSFRLPVTGLFVFIGAEPHLEWLPDAIGRDKLGYILTGVDAENSGKWPLKDRTPCALETTVPRILAAGDVRSGSTKRVGFAVGDGSLAVTCTHRLRTLRA